MASLLQLAIAHQCLARVAGRKAAAGLDAHRGPARGPRRPGGRLPGDGWSLDGARRRHCRRTRASRTGKAYGQLTKRQLPMSRETQLPGRQPPNQTAALMGRGKAMRALSRARPRRIIADARSADIRKGLGKGASEEVRRLTTKPGQITLTPTPNLRNT